MADIIDRASKYLEQGLSERLASIRAAVNDDAAEPADECEDCGDGIPEARRRAVPGCTTCVFCQEKRERGL